jgi:hypothetical protein
MRSRTLRILLLLLVVLAVGSMKIYEGFTSTCSVSKDCNECTTTAQGNCYWCSYANGGKGKCYDINNYCPNNCMTSDCNSGVSKCPVGGSSGGGSSGGIGGGWSNWRKRRRRIDN